MSVNVVLNCLMIQNCTEIGRHKKGSDDWGSVWVEVVVLWDLGDINFIHSFANNL